MDEQFFNECVSAVSAVVGTANGMAPDQRPFCFMQNRDDTGFVFCFSDHWHRDMDGTWPLTSFGSGDYSSKASGFLLLHELTLAEKTILGILEEDGKRWEDLGLGKKKDVLYMPDAARDLVERKGICDVERWDEAFNEARRRQPAMVSAFLTIRENGDGTYSAEASAQLESPISWKVAFKAAKSGSIASVDDVRELLQAALAEITPWVKGPEATESILERMAVDAAEEVIYTDPANEWPDEITPEQPPTIERAREIIVEQEQEECGPSFGMGMAFA